jgi:hypothetical protein
VAGTPAVVISIDDFNRLTRPKNSLVSFLRESPAHGRHDCGGWFHFVGSLETGEFPVVPMAESFAVWLRRKARPELESLKGASALSG